MQRIEVDRMSNIEDDIKAKGFIEGYKQIKNNASIIKSIDKDFFFELVDFLLEKREQDKARIKELEEERQLVGMPVRNKRSGKIGIVLHQWESRSIAVLENISPRVINTHDSWDTLEIITDEIKQTKTESDSIPKQKVKDKIEELKNAKRETTRENWHYIYSIQLKILQELLEERE